MISHLAHVSRRCDFTFYIALVVLLVRAITVVDVAAFERLREAGRATDYAGAVLVLNHGRHRWRVLPDFQIGRAHV